MSKKNNIWLTFFPCLWAHRISKVGLQLGRFGLIVAGARQRSIMRLVIKLWGTDDFVEGLTAHAEGCLATWAICMSLFIPVHLLSTLYDTSCAFGGLATSHIFCHSCVIQLFENCVESVTIGSRLMVLFFLGKEIRAFRDAKAHRFTICFRLLELWTIVIEDMLGVLFCIVQKPGTFREGV